MEIIPGNLARWMRFGRGPATARPSAPAFVSAYVQDMVIAIQRQRRRSGVLAGIVVLLACPGLFGLSISAAERRTGEIGIRKAIGASSGDIVILLLSQFIRPVLAAILIAWPLGWWLMKRWLSGFPYHIALGPLPFRSGRRPGADRCHLDRVGPCGSHCSRSAQQPLCCATNRVGSETVKHLLVFQSRVEWTFVKSVSRRAATGKSAGTIDAVQSSDHADREDPTVSARSHGDAMTSVVIRSARVRRHPWS